MHGENSVTRIATARKREVLRLRQTICEQIVWASLSMTELG